MLWEKPQNSINMYIVYKKNFEIPLLQATQHIFSLFVFLLFFLNFLYTFESRSQKSLSEWNWCYGHYHYHSKLKSYTNSINCIYSHLTSNYKLHIFKLKQKEKKECNNNNKIECTNHKYQLIRIVWNLLCLCMVYQF